MRQIDLCNWRAVGHAGVGNYDIDGAMLFACRAGHGLAVTLARDIGGDGDRILETCYDFFQRSAPPPGNGYGSPRVGERPGDRRADAGASAGNQCMLAVERAHHTFPVMTSVRALSRYNWSRPGRYGFGQAAPS